MALISSEHVRKNYAQQRKSFNERKQTVSRWEAFCYDREKGNSMSKDFASLTTLALQVSNHYDELNIQDGQPKWGASERMAGFVGDVGTLSKLIMAKKGLRRGSENLDAELKHELADCLWSIMVIADDLQIDLEAEFINVMEELTERIERQKADSSLLR